MCSRVWGRTCSCMWRPEVTVRCHPWSLSILRIEAWSHTWTRSSASQLVWLARLLWEPPLSLSLCWDFRHAACPPGFYYYIHSFIHWNTESARMHAFVYIIEVRGHFWWASSGCHDVGLREQTRGVSLAESIITCWAICLAFFSQVLGVLNSSPPHTYMASTFPTEHLPNCQDAF